jgi:hypothetical protein
MDYDVLMRTTLTLEPDVALKLKRRMARDKITLKAAVNDALRAGLSQTEKKALPPFKVVPHHSGGFLPGIDPDRLNQLVDELQVEEYLKKASR